MVGKITVTTGNFPGQGEALIYVAFEDNSARTSRDLSLLDKKTNKNLSRKLDVQEFTGKEGEIVAVDIDNFYKTILVVGAGKSKEFNFIRWRAVLAAAFRYLQSNKITSVTVTYFDLLGKDYFEIGKNLSLSLFLSNYHFDYYKSAESKKKLKRITNLELLIDPNLTSQVKKGALEQGVDYGKLLAEGICLTRDLVNQPASHIHPDTLVEQAFEIEKEAKGKIKVEVLDEEECRRLGMGAYLGVAQGSEKKAKFIVLHYVGAGSSGPKKGAKTAPLRKICLIGKSITFDSGGLSLKPSEHMELMKMDMAGGATVLGVFKILAKDTELHGIKNTEIYGILPACENMPSGRAIKPGDIVTTLNKKTIEVLNTDAEGRLTLADALAYAEKYVKPDIIIDMATLTGACIVALGKHLAGLFGNDEKTTTAFEKAAQKEGEEIWPMPLHKHYAKSLKSPVADLKNIGGGKYSGGAITAALFLSEFVQKSKWIHIDIAGPAFNDGEIYGLINHGGTGWGILSIMEFIK